MNGECVRLKRGVFSDKKTYGTDPLAVAKGFELAGARMLHIVDLDGARTGVPKNSETIRALCTGVRIPVEVGGGIRDSASARMYLSSGVSRVVLGTAALTDIELISSLIEEFGSDRVVVAVEVKDGKIATEGWQKTTEGNYLDFAERLKRLGVSEILCTDVDRDGTMTEPNRELVSELVKLGFNVVASGGITSVADIIAMKESGARSAIIGTALYEKRITLPVALAAARPRSRLTKRIIPCLDVKEGKVVKGVSFENLQAVGNPVALGKKYSEEGADELVFLDISASKEGRETMFDVVENVARSIYIPFTVGGGISSIEQIRRLLSVGADKVSINTAAVKNPDLISDAVRAFGQQCVVVAIDAKKQNGGTYKVFLKGGTEETGLEVVAWAREVERRGAGEILLTSMDKDGTRAGYDIELLRRVSDVVNIPVIASGGAGSLEDLQNAFIEGRADAALVASLFHYGEHTIREAKEYLSAQGIPIRI